VAAAVGVAPNALARLRQVHGVAAVRGIRNSAASPPALLPEADIVIVGDAGVAGAVQVADCVPLLLADRARGVVAAVHVGWRGLAARGPRAALDALAQSFDTRPEDVVAALGPSIGACCYEVGPDVRATFSANGFSDEAIARWFLRQPAALEGNPVMPRVESSTRRPEHWFFDGWASAADQLRGGGVPEGQIFIPRLCTASHPELYCSYRRDGAPSGRLAAAIACRARPLPQAR
jgi:polyphenol oxidase